MTDRARYKRAAMAMTEAERQRVIFVERDGNAFSPLAAACVAVSASRGVKAALWDAVQVAVKDCKG